MISNPLAGVESATTAYGVGDLPRGLAAADLDGDGDIDLVASNLLSYSVSVLLNQSRG